MEDFLTEVCEELKKLELDFVVVGGSAIEEEGYDISTSDLDFVLTPKEFHRIEERLEDSSKFRIRDRVKTIIETGFMFENSWRTVEFLDPSYFSGEKTPEEFIDYIKRYRSKKKDIAYVAKPEIVFFMRLMVVDWEIYIQKILRDMKAGLPRDILDDVIEIGGYLGVQDRIKERVDRTKEIIDSQM